ncbi:MAG: DNA-3-methyladenine glycosylase 2 family protein [Deltaproteobacteria bacterium]|nr:DNA-3-methyladenine glycosylase 2 family protein [Deltaproteobacteria bacterium]MBW2122406.1 DNA-3-methyladenine glycosylase 2 family protein [Deltaproteobacteria bacterium]
MKVERLTKPAFDRALGILGDRDPDLGCVLSSLGPPPMWVRGPGFPTLVRVILEQQVSLASARAAFKRLRQSVPALTPDRFLELNGERLRQMGFSSQKTRYCRNLAKAITEGSLCLEWLEAMDDDQARAQLVKIKGIGRWTADIYLVMALRRPDVWPMGDLALNAAVERVKRLKARPSWQELMAISETWKPWRAVAARLLWHYYLSNPLVRRYR